MKKAILTFGLFSLMMVLTSFTSPETLNNNSTTQSVELVGGASAGGNRKVDLVGGASAGGNRKVD